MDSDLSEAALMLPQSSPAPALVCAPPLAKLVSDCSQVLGRQVTGGLPVEASGLELEPIESRTRGVDTFSGLLLNSGNCSLVPDALSTPALICALSVDSGLLFPSIVPAAGHVPPIEIVLAVVASTRRRGCRSSRRASMSNRSALRIVERDECKQRLNEPSATRASMVLLQDRTRERRKRAAERVRRANSIRVELHLEPVRALALFEGAVRVAAIELRGVAIVALLAAVEHLVAAHRVRRAAHAAAARARARQPALPAVRRATTTTAAAMRRATTAAAACGAPPSPPLPPCGAPPARETFVSPPSPASPISFVAPPRSPLLPACPARRRCSTLPRRREPFQQPRLAHAPPVPGEENPTCESEQASKDSPSAASPNNPQRTTRLHSRRLTTDGQVRQGRFAIDAARGKH